MHTFKLCMGCRQACTQISCLDVWDIGVCNLQSAIINIFEANYRVYDNILMHWYNIWLQYKFCWVTVVCKIVSLNPLFCNTVVTAQDLVPEIIDSGPMCIIDLFQNKSVAYLTHRNESSWSYVIWPKVSKYYSLTFPRHTPGISQTYPRHSKPKRNYNSHYGNGVVAIFTS